MSRALITGIGGQDGSYLAELLLDAGYEVVGLVRPGSPRYANLAAIEGRIELRNVYFRYSESDPCVLEDINLTIAPGEFVRICGPSLWNGRT